MLSVILLAPSCADPMAGRVQEAVVRSLAALVSAAVADVVRDVCLVGAPEARLSAVADHAGCALVEDSDHGRGVAQAVRAARGDRIFVLTAGYAPMSGFIDEMSDWAMSATPPAAALRAEPASFAQRLFPSLASCVGIVASKQDIVSADGDTPSQLARNLRARTLLTRARRVV